MPKTTKVPLADDVPFWDHMIAEFGDPRPYEPIEIGHVVATNEPCVDVDDWSNAHDELRRHVRNATACFDGLTRSAAKKFDAVWTWPPGFMIVVRDTELTQEIPRVYYPETSS